jgi:phage-related protein
MDDVTKSLAKTFEGAAATSADTYEGKMKRLGLAFEDVRDTVGGFVLDAITPMVEKIVKNVMPALAAFADGLGKSLGPTLANITKIVRDDLLPILISWWKFLYNEVIPAIGSVVRPILEGLSSAFNTIRNAVKNNSTELEPFYDVLKLVWGFIKNNLAPLLGGAFKLALETIGTIVGGLVTGFSRLVGFITSTVNKIKEFVNFIKDNPVTRFFFGDSNDKSLKAGAAQEVPFFDPNGVFGDGGISTGSSSGGFFPGADPSTFTGAPLSAYSPAMQAAILRREELKAETERLREAREDKAAARAAATGGLSTSERIVINVNSASVIDEEGFNRAIVSALNNSTFRGTNGPGSLVAV